eukprot:2415419-Pleurochrysis_carterae.AAC.1
MKRAKTYAKKVEPTNRGASVGKWAGRAKERTNAKRRAEGRAQASPALLEGYRRPGTTYSAEGAKRWRPKTLRSDPSDDGPHEPQKNDEETLMHRMRSLRRPIMKLWTGDMVNWARTKMKKWIEKIMNTGLAFNEDGITWAS